MLTVLPLPFKETTETVRARMLADLPARHSSEQGSWGRDFLEINVPENVRIWDAINRVLAQSHYSFATGDVLDAHAADYGLTRKTGSKSSGLVRFIAPTGTAVPSGTIVEVPGVDPDAERIRYTTVNVGTAIVTDAGYVDVLAVATNSGTAFDQAPAAVSMLDSVVANIQAVTNVTAMTGGEDPEDDPTLRGRIDDQAHLPTGSGTELDYVVWGKEVPGVGDVVAYGLWDDAGTSGAFDPGSGSGDGSVLVVVRDSDLAPVDWQVLQNAQVHIDPSRQLLALFENGEPWVIASGTAAVGWSPVAQHGASSLQIAAGDGSTTVVSLVRAMNLSRFDVSDEFWIWVKPTTGAWSAVAASSYLEFRVDANNYFRVPFSGATATAKPTTGNAWWLMRAPKSAAVATGLPTWDAISELRIGQTTTAAATVIYDYGHVRDETGASGKGRAPVGASVTVSTPVSRGISVTASLVLDSGFSLTGAGGTTNAGAVIEAAMIEMLRQLKPGQDVYWTDIADVLHDVPGVLDYSNLVVTNGTTTADAAGEAVPVSVNEYVVLAALTLS